MLTLTLFSLHLSLLFLPLSLDYWCHSLLQNEHPFATRARGLGLYHYTLMTSEEENELLAAEFIYKIQEKDSN